jgi:hypothetical protein
MKVRIAGHPQIVTVATGKGARRAIDRNPAVASWNRMKKRQRKLARAGRRMKHV